MKKTRPILPLRGCPVCSCPEIMTFYVSDRRYRYRCCACGQFFEFNASSQLHAYRIWNDLFKR